ncbi:MAG: hypothetical protein QW755_05010 [Nitrososphaerota archaeon]
MEKKKNILIEIKSFDEIVILASSLPIPFINIFKKEENENIAFVFFEIVPSNIPVIFYTKIKEVIKNKFVYFNRTTGKISFGDTISLEPNTLSIPIINVISHNLELE